MNMRLSLTKKTYFLVKWSQFFPNSWLKLFLCKFDVSSFLLLIFFPTEIDKSYRIKRFAYFSLIKLLPQNFLSQSCIQWKISLHVLRVFGLVIAEGRSLCQMFRPRKRVGGLDFRLSLFPCGKRQRLLRFMGKRVRIGFQFFADLQNQNTSA